MLCSIHLRVPVCWLIGLIFDLGGWLIHAGARSDPLVFHLQLVHDGCGDGCMCGGGGGAHSQPRLCSVRAVPRPIGMYLHMCHHSFE